MTANPTEKNVSVISQIFSVYLPGGTLILSCLLFASVMISQLFDPADPYTPILFSPFWIGAIWLALNQYFDLACYQRSAAMAFSSPWIIIGCLCMASGAAFAIEMILMSKTADFPGESWGSYLSIALFGLFLLIVGLALSRLNNRRIKAASKYENLTCASGLTLEVVTLNMPLAQNYIFRKWFGYAIIAVLIAACSWYLVQIQPPIQGIGLTRAQAYCGQRLPKTSTNIAFKRGFHQTIAFSFDISESDFRKWIESEPRWEYLRPIDQPQIVYPPELYQKSANCIEILNGLEAGFGKQRGACAIYDSKTGRAYYRTFY